MEPVIGIGTLLEVGKEVVAVKAIENQKDEFGNSSAVVVLENGIRLNSNEVESMFILS